MRRILIITYYFPPCGLTSANRTFSWAKYLSKFGFHPVIITRNWEQKINTETDLYKESGSEVIHQKHDTHEVFYVPYKQTKKDKLLVKDKGKNVILRKVFSLFEQLSQFFIGFSDPLIDLYKFADQYLKENSANIDSMVVSADPFVLFKYGNKLAKKYDLKWLADYRDDWTTTDWKRPPGALNKLIFSLEKKREKEWLSSASYVSSVSDYYTQKISDYTGVEGKVIINGFFHEEFVDSPEVDSFDVFTITYVGILYNEQKIETFIDGFKTFIKEKEGAVKIRLLLAGLGFNEQQKQRILDYTADIQEFVEITDWASRKEIIETIFRSNALLHVAAEDIKGAPSSTVSEYIASNKPVLLCPTDHDAMESMVKKAAESFICDSAEEAAEKLNYLWEYYQLSGKVRNEFNQRSYVYSREHQTKLLSEILEENSKEIE